MDYHYRARCPSDIEILMLAGVTGGRSSYFVDDRLKETPLFSPRRGFRKRQVESQAFHSNPWAAILIKLPRGKRDGKYLAYMILIVQIYSAITFRKNF